MTGNPRLRIPGITIPLWAAYAVLVGSAAVGLAVVYLFDPRQPGLYPVCLFFGLTGWHCPGCGTLRALPAVGYSFAAGGLRAYRLPAPPRVFIPARWIWALLAAILAFWLLRNLPFGPFFFLAP